MSDLAAVRATLKNFTDPASASFAVKDIEVAHFARRVVITVRLCEDTLIDGRVVNEFTIRMPRARAEVLRLYLCRVLEA